MAAAACIEMANFLLVHGAWHGAWCWRDVARTLVLGGHRAHAVTLTGVGERAHLLSSQVTLETHISDVANAIEAEELRDVVLVLHSYAGMLGTAIADRMQGRLSHLAYVDAVLPEPGESWSSTHAVTTREARIAAAESTVDFAFQAPDPAVYGIAGDLHAWVRRRQTPHPGHTYIDTLDFDPRRVARIPRTFVNCKAPALVNIDVMRARAIDPGFWGGAWLPGSRVVDLATGHDAMVSAPDELARVLLTCTS